MNRILATAAAILSVSTMAWAQQPQDSGRGKPDPARMEEMRAKMQERRQAEFKKADKDGDGALSKSEVEGMPRLAKDFDAIDANKDGKISQDEMRAFGEKRRAEMQAQHGGMGGMGGRGGAREGEHAGHEGAQQGKRASPEQMKQQFEERFKKADADGDGALSRAEAEKSMPMLAKHFDQIDANKDGKLTQDEIRSSMAKRHEQMEKRRGERHGPHGQGSGDKS